MVQSHLSGADLCLIGNRGQGKSHVAREFAQSLGYAPIETLHLYKDMTARDLLLRRSTNSKGETLWQSTPLVEGLRHGRLVILDGLDRLAVGTIAAILRLIEDREIVLFDGSRYIPGSKYEMLKKKEGLTDAQLAKKQTFPIHPRFRIIALANPPSRTSPWFTNELLHLFHFFSLDGPGLLDYSSLLRKAVPTANGDAVRSICDLAVQLGAISEDKTNGVSAALSLRQLLRVARRSALYPKDTAGVIATALLLPFVPTAEHKVITDAMELHGFAAPIADFHADSLIRKVVIAHPDGTKTLRIGTAECAVALAQNEALVPDTLFFDMPKHLRILEAMLKDFTLDEHLLLLGNQGVGKNKLTDHLLMLLNREREYIQLHRDTTVQSLTLLPSLRNGVLVYEDSPLVKAMANGRVLVIDEFDKAPTEVVCILKGLLEDGEVLLADGRRFISPKSSLYAAAADLASGALGPGARVQLIHPRFKVFALANRPGYPFLGNDFFREMGDVFACHIVDAPDLESEIQLLRAYGPDVDVEVIRMLSETFCELRSMTDEGSLSYPYSTRELVSVVRHLQQYPEDTITQVLENLFAFDAFDPELRQMLYEVFQKHGIPLGVGRPADEDFQMHQLAVAQVFDDGPVPVRTVREEPVGSLAVQLQRSEMVDPNVPPEPEQRRRIDGVLSARVNRFSEEVLAFKVPHTGDVIGICALEDSLFALTDTLELYAFDLATSTFSSHSLVMLSGYVTSWGGPSSTPLIAVPSLRVIVTYDILNRQLFCIHPFAPEGTKVTKMAVDLHPNNLISPRPVGMFQLHFEDIVGIHAIRSNLAVLICVSSLEKFYIELPVGTMINKAECLGSTRILLHCTVNEYSDLPGQVLYACDLIAPSADASNVSGADFMRALQRVELSVLKAEPLGEQYKGKGYDHDGIFKMDTAPTSGFTDTIFSAPDTLCGFFKQVPQRTKGASWRVLAYPRAEEYDNALTVDTPNTSPFLSKRRLSVWMKQARVLVTVISSPMAVLLEVFEPLSQGMRTIPLSKTVSDSSAFVANDEQQLDMLFLRNEGMPHIVSAIETPDGKLALLLTNREIRILELRDAELFAEETLWDRLVDGGGSGGEEGEGNGDGDGEGEGEGEGEGSGNGSGSGSGDGDGEGSGGSGRGSGGKAGKGGGGGGGGFSYSEDRMRAAEDQAVGDRAAPDGAGSELFDRELIKEAREKAREAIERQQESFDLDDMDETQYADIYGSVQQEIQQLRVVLEAVESKEKERVWLKQQTHGDLDDNRLVDGATGDRNIYKKRGENDMLFGTVQRLPKRLQFVVDVSSSMSVMNGDVSAEGCLSTAPPRRLALL